MSSNVAEWVKLKGTQNRYYYIAGGLILGEVYQHCAGHWVGWDLTHSEDIRLADGKATGNYPNVGEARKGVEKTLEEELEALVIEGSI